MEMVLLIAYIVLFIFTAYYQKRQLDLFRNANEVQNKLITSMREYCDVFDIKKVKDLISLREEMARQNHEKEINEFKEGMKKIIQDKEKEVLIKDKTWSYKVGRKKEIMIEDIYKVIGEISVMLYIAIEYAGVPKNERLMIANSVKHELGKKLLSHLFIQLNEKGLKSLEKGDSLDSSFQCNIFRKCFARRMPVESLARPVI